MEAGKIIKLIIMLGLLGALAYTTYYLYQNMPGAVTGFQVKNYNDEIQKLHSSVNASNEARQFYSNMRFKDRVISYFINPDCAGKKEEGMKKAFSIIEEKTPVSFKTASEQDAEILIGCSRDSYEKEENVFIGGEGGPTKIMNLSIYPLILKGKIILYNETSCDYPVTEIHELFHVFGFDHINKSDRLMYPYIECNQTINEDVLDIMNKIYSVDSLPEIYFTNITATKDGAYLNFDVMMENQGLSDAKNVSIEVYAENEKIDSFPVGDVDIGVAKSFYVNNLKLPSRDVSQVRLVINSGVKELNNNNNAAELAI